MIGDDGELRYAKVLVAFSQEFVEQGGLAVKQVHMETAVETRSRSQPQSALPHLAAADVVLDKELVLNRKRHPNRWGDLRFSEFSLGAELTRIEAEQRRATRLLEQLPTLLRLLEQDRLRLAEQLTECRKDLGLEFGWEPDRMEAIKSV